MSFPNPAYWATIALTLPLWAQPQENHRLRPGAQTSIGNIEVDQGHLPDQAQMATFRGRQLPYVVVDGMAVHAGDMILGRATDFELTRGEETTKILRSHRSLRRRELASVDTSYLWPDGVIPYEIDGAISAEQRQRIHEAIHEWNSKTVITLVERSAETDYVRFLKASTVLCPADIGRKGGEQSVFVSPKCSVVDFIHEIGHTVGLWHEHQRVDRDSYLMVLGENVDKRESVQYVDLHPGDGPYDYASIMH